MKHETQVGSPADINYSLEDMLSMLQILEKENMKAHKRKQKGKKANFHIIPEKIEIAAMYVAMNVLGEDPNKPTHSLAVCNGNYIMVIRPSAETMEKQHAENDAKQLNLLDHIEEVEGGKVIEMAPKSEESNEQGK